MSLLKRFFTVTILKCWRNHRYFVATRTVGQWSRDNTKKTYPPVNMSSFNFPKMFLSFFITRNKKTTTKRNVSIDVLAKCKLNVRPIFKTSQRCFRILAATAIVIRLWVNGTSETENTQSYHTRECRALLIYLQNSRKNKYVAHT